MSALQFIWVANFKDFGISFFDLQTFQTFAATNILQMAHNGLEKVTF